MIFRAFTFLLTAIALGQARPEFEVVAIHPVGFQVPYNIQFSDSELKITAIPVRDFIHMSYHLQPSQLKGGPSWIEYERFEIHAKSSVALTTDAYYQAMQNLLADRFHLKMRREIVEKRTYSIKVVDRSKLKSSAEGGALSKVVTPIGTDEVQVQLKNFAIRDFVVSLSMVLQTTVKDETGLSGGFDFEGALDKPLPNGALNFQSLLGKFGLRLEAHETPVEIYTIEFVERPSEN